MMYNYIKKLSKYTKATPVMTTYTAKIANLTAAAESIYTNIYNEQGEKEAAKVRNLAKKLEIGFEDALLVLLLKTIKYGAINVNGRWFPVIAGEMMTSGHTFSSGALSDASHYAAQRGVTLKV